MTDDTAGKTETAESRNASMKNTAPEKCHSNDSRIIQQPTPVGDKAAPAVRD